MESLRRIQPGTRLRDDIIAQIREGHLRPGDAILPIDELSGRYAAAKETIRKAVQGLVKDGYLSCRRGRGTFVREFQESARKTRILIRLNVHSRDIVSGMRRLVEEYNSSSTDVHVEPVFDDRAASLPEIALISAFRKGQEAYRLDVFHGYADLVASLHPRFRCEDIARSGHDISTYIPLLWSSRCLGVNRDIQGIPADSFPRTWDDVLSWARNAQTMPNLSGGTFLMFHRASGIGSYLSFYWMAGGGDMYDPGSRRLDIRRSAFIRWLKFFGELIDLSELYQRSAERDPLLSGKFLFDLFAGPWLIKQSEESEEPVNYSLHPGLSAGQGEGSAVLSFYRLGILRKDLNEREKSACWSFIRYLLSDRVQARLIREIGVLPVRQELLGGLAAGNPISAFEGLLGSARVLQVDHVNKVLRDALAAEFYNFLTVHRDAEKSLERFEQTAKALVALEGDGEAAEGPGE